MISPNLMVSPLMASVSTPVNAASSLAAVSVAQAARDLGTQCASSLALLERGGTPEAGSPPPAAPSAPLQKAPVPFLQRLTSGLAGLVLGALVLAGCQFNVSGLAPLDASSDTTDALMTDAMPDRMPDAMPDMGNDATTDGMDAGPAAPPTPVLPADAETLPPTLAYLYWQDGAVPAGRSIVGYELCSTATALTDIDDAAECPNNAMLTANHAVLDPVARLSNNFWKVRTHFDDASVSEWSAVQTFSADDSLVAWWRFDGNSMDSSTHGLNGVLQNGAVTAAGLDGQAFQGDGTNDYTDMGSPTALQLAGPLTVSAWVNGNGTPVSADTGIVNVGSLNYALTYHTDGRVYFYVNNGGNHLRATMSPNAWHHVAGVFDGTTNAGGMRLYLDNGAPVMGASMTATTGATGSFWIGRYSSSYFHGLIDNVTIYNQALSNAALLNENCAIQAQGGVSPLPAACTP